jgi:hypothetical protein
MIHIVAILTVVSGQRETLSTDFKKNLDTVRLERDCLQYNSVISSDFVGRPATSHPNLPRRSSGAAGL